MRATVQIDKYAWQSEKALYVFYIDFDIKPRRDDTIEIEHYNCLMILQKNIEKLEKIFS